MMMTGRLSTPRRSNHAVGEIRRLKRAVVLGEPGAGKTTTLWKLAGYLSGQGFLVLRLLLPIPLLIRLGLCD
jgi:signal recognition particle GTPase